MSELIAAEQSDSGALVPGALVPGAVPQLIVLDNEVGLLTKQGDPFIRPRNLNNFEMLLC